MSQATLQAKTRTEIETQPSTGNALLVFVGLGMAFLLIVALLGVAKSGSLFSESNLLYVALIFYSGAAALYMGIRRHRHRSLREVRVRSDDRWPGREYPGSRTSLVRSRPSAFRQPVRDVVEFRLDRRPAYPGLRAQVQGQDHRFGHDAAGGGRRHPDAVAAFGSAPARARAAIHLAAHPRDAGDVGLCRLRHELRPWP